MPCAVRVQAYIWSLGARPSPSWWRALEAATWSAPILPQRQQQQQQHSSLPQVEQRGSFSFAGQHSSDCQVDQHSSSQHRNLHGRHGSDWAGAHTRAAIAPGTAPPRRPALFPYAACHVLGSMALAGVHVYKGEGGGCHVLSRVWARHMPHKGRDVRGRCMALAGACVCRARVQVWAWQMGGSRVWRVACQWVCVTHVLGSVARAGGQAWDC